MQLELVREVLLGQPTFKTNPVYVHGKAAENLVGTGHMSTLHLPWM